MAGKNYRDLVAWQKAMNLVEKVYRISNKFPNEEVYSLTSQIRRAVVSIPSNIAEGEGRASKKEFIRFLSISYGSLREVETQLLIASRLNYSIPSEIKSAMDLCGEVGRIINGLIRSLKSSGQLAVSRFKLPTAYCLLHTKKRRIRK